MNNLTLNKQLPYLFLLIIILWVVIFSSLTLTTKPHLWADEAKSIELAKNFLFFHRLDIQIAPGEFSGFPELLQSTGYPLLVPLAGLFKIFGFSFKLARIYMLAWMLILLIVIFLFAQRLFGSRKAVLPLLLLSTFPSFFDSGRTVVGEIPGFVFLIAGLYFLFFKESYYWSGLFLGLAIITKPSVFLLALPAIILVFLLERKYFLKRSLKVVVGMLPAVLGWIMLFLDNPLSKAAWLSIAKFYQNPYNAVSVSENIWRNLLNAPQSFTLIYFGILFLVIILGRYWEEDSRLKSFYNFAIIYSILAFAYYLRSPGWLRYILISELLILFLLPRTVFSLAGRIRGYFPKIKISMRWLAFGPILLLVGIQLLHLFTGAKIFYSDSEIVASSFLNKEFPNQPIGVLNSLALSVLLKTNNKFQIVEMTGIPAAGKNPLFISPLPEVIVSAPDEKFLADGSLILKNDYRFLKNLSGYDIYLLR